MDINVLGSSVDKNGFKLPKKQQRKFKRQDRQRDSQNIQSYAHFLKNGTPRANTAKKQFTWGKSEGTSSSGLRGVMPDVFMSRLDVSTTLEMLKEHFIAEGIEVSKVAQNPIMKLISKLSKYLLNQLRILINSNLGTTFQSILR